MGKIPGIYVEIRGDSTLLNKEIDKAKDIVTNASMEMSNSLGNALSPAQIQNSLKNLIRQLSTLSHSTHINSDAFKKLGVDLGEFQHLTGMTSERFDKLQRKLLETHHFKAQEAALKRIAKAADLSAEEIKELGDSMNVSDDRINKVTASLGKGEVALKSYADRVRGMPPIKMHQTLGAATTQKMDTSMGGKVDAFAGNLTSVTGSAKSAHAAFDLLESDMASLAQSSGLTSAQITDLKNKIANTTAEKAQEQAFLNLVKSAGLTEVEIQKLGNSMGVSEAQIKRVTVAALGAAPALKSLSVAALDNVAASTKSAASSFANDMTVLASGGKIAGETFNALEHEMKELRGHVKLTDKEFDELKDKLVNTTGEKLKINALKNLARQADLTEKEVRELGRQFGMAPPLIDKATASLKKAGKATESTGQKMATMVATVATYSIGFAAFSASVSAIAKEFRLGFSAIEEFNQTVATSAAYMTTFSVKAEQGDLGTAYKEAYAYAKVLAEKLEMIDAKTIASGKNLQDMSEAFLRNRVQLDAYNEEQMEGFTSLATALALITKGAPDATKQIYQEIDAMMRGEAKNTDKLAKFFLAKDKNFKNNIKKWREEGTVIENLGKMTKAFNADVGTLDDLWVTVGSTMETINKRILRGGFITAYNDLIKLAKEFNKSLQDSDGNLTPLAVMIQKTVDGAYTSYKKLASVVWEVHPIHTVKREIELADKALIKMGLNVRSLFPEDISEQTKVLREIAELENQLKGGEKKWWQFTLFEDPQAEVKRVGKITDKIVELRKELTHLQDVANLKHLANMGVESRVTVPEIALVEEEPLIKPADWNAAHQKEADYLKAVEEKKIALIKASVDKQQQINENAYELGLVSHLNYLDEKHRLTEKAIKAELVARQKALKDAQDVVKKLAPVVDSNKNPRPDKTAKARYEALKKVEKAQQALIETQKELTLAQVGGAHESTIANIENAESYKQIQISLLESQGKMVEAAKEQAALNQKSLERQKLMADARAGEFEAQKALFALQEMDNLTIKRAGLDMATNEKNALVEIADLNGAYAESIDLQVELIEIERERAELAGASEAELELLDMQAARLKNLKDPMAAFAQTWSDLAKEWGNVSDIMVDVAEGTAQAMNDAFSDFFFDALEGNLDDLEDYASAFASSINRVIADALAQKASSMVLGALFHTGGVVGVDAAPMRTVSQSTFKGAPKYHSGLLPDEFPAILKKGETVFTEGQTKVLSAALTSKKSDDGGGVVNNNMPISVSGYSRREAEELQRVVQFAVEEHLRKVV